MTWAETIAKTEGFLCSKGVPDARVAAELLSARLLRIGRGMLTNEYSQQVAAPQLEAMRRAMRRLAAGEPLQYVLGYADFYSYRFNVAPGVLIPRPETEELVTLALKLAPANGKVLDMGTGSGAIPIALKYERPDLSHTAADLSPEALNIAQLNARCYKTEIEFIHSDLWQNLQGRSFDLVTANLPYVSEKEYKECSQEIFFEPVMALTAPHEGLELMEKMISELQDHLSPGGAAVFELSHGQNPLICAYGESLNFKAESVRDLEGKARFVILYKE
jgi:release factor glutamine methyltransferase